MCIHKFVDGFGSMGDAVVCVKCGLDKYPEALSLTDRVFSLTVSNDGKYMHRGDRPPYVVRYPSAIYFGTDLDSWTHYFDTHGILCERVSHVKDN